MPFFCGVNMFKIKEILLWFLLYNKVNMYKYRGAKKIILIVVLSLMVLMACLSCVKILTKNEEDAAESATIYNINTKEQFIAFCKVCAKLYYK